MITRLDVRLGDRVSQGQLLAELDNVAARLAYEQALSQLNSAESQMNTARLALERTRGPCRAVWSTGPGPPLVTIFRSKKVGAM